MKNRILRIIFFSVAGLILLLYAGGAIYTQYLFFPGSKINGVNVGGMNAQEAQEDLNQNAPALTIVEKNAETRDEMTEVIEMKEIGYWENYETQPILDAQPGLDWPVLLSKPIDVDLEKMNFIYDPELLEDQIDELYCMQDQNQVAPVNAGMEGDDNNAVRILPADDGCEIMEEKARILIRNAVDMEEDNVDLFSTCYVTADLSEEDQLFQAKAKMVESVYNKKISVILYDDVTYEIDGSKLRKIVKINPDLTYRIEGTALMDAVNKIGEKYPKVTHRRSIITSKGEVVYVGLPDDVYEYTFDIKGTSESVREQLLKFGNVSCYASWTRNGTQGLNKNEFCPAAEWDGGYIEISIDDQHLWYYDATGKLRLESDVVTGEKDWLDTPCGVYYVMNMSTHNVLQGGAISDYWIGFIGGQYGVHDAYRWRREFGGDIYTWDGSHGCVNMPLEEMEELYELVDIEKETAVVIYELSTGR